MERYEKLHPGPQLSLKLVEQASSAPTLTYDEQIKQDTVKSYFECYGTGDIFLQHLIEYIWNRIRQLSINPNKSSLLCALDLANSSYSACCKALKIETPFLAIARPGAGGKIRLISSALSSNSSSLTRDADKKTVDGEDINDEGGDMAWFFSEEDGSQLVKTHTHGSIASLSPVSPRTGMFSSDAMSSIVGSSTSIDNNGMDDHNTTTTTSSTTTSSNSTSSSTTTTTGTCTTTGSTRTSSIFGGTRNVLIGLQHCLAHELNPLMPLLPAPAVSAGASTYAPTGPDTRRVEQVSGPDFPIIALPMQLAQAVVAHLIKFTLNTSVTTTTTTTTSVDSAGSHHDEANTLLSVAQIDYLEEEEEEEEEVEGYGYTELKPLLAPHVHSVKVNGLSQQHCGVYPGQLVVGCSSQEYNRIIDLGHHQHHRTNNNNNSNLSSDSMPLNSTTSTKNVGSPGTKCVDSALFRRTVVIDTHMGVIGDNLDTENTAVGSSQQARAVKLKRETTATEYINALRHRFGEEDMYIQQICALLQVLQVELLLCPVSMAMQALLADALNCRGIAVLGISTSRERISAARLAGAIIVEDVIGVLESDVGTNCIHICPIVELPVLQYRGHDSSSSTTIQVDESNNSHNTANYTSNGVNNAIDTEGVVLINNAHTAGIDGRQQPLQEQFHMGDTRHCDWLVSLAAHPYPTVTIESQQVESQQQKQEEEEEEESPVVSVVIASPTAVMTLALFDKYWRCLHRLISVLQLPQGTGRRAAPKTSYPSADNMCNNNNDFHSSNDDDDNNNNNNNNNNNCRSKSSSCGRNTNDVNRYLSFRYMPGAGVPEMVTILRINEIIRLHLHPNIHMEIIMVLKIFQDALVQYIGAILLNNGYNDVSKTQSCIDTALQQLLRSLHCLGTSQRQLQQQQQHSSLPPPSTGSKAASKSDSVHSLMDFSLNENDDNDDDHCYNNDNNNNNNNNNNVDDSGEQKFRHEDRAATHATNDSGGDYSCDDILSVLSQLTDSEKLELPVAIDLSRVYNGFNSNSYSNSRSDSFIHGQSSFSSRLCHHYQQQQHHEDIQVDQMMRDTTNCGAHAAGIKCSPSSAPVVSTPVVSAPLPAKPLGGTGSGSTVLDSISIRCNACSAAVLAIKEMVCVLRA